MLNPVETSITAAYAALGVDPDYPKPLLDAVATRKAAHAVRDSKPRDLAHELLNAGARRWPSITEEVAAHNTRHAEERKAISNGLVSRAESAVEHEYRAHATGYLDRTHPAICTLVEQFVEHATSTPTLNAEDAIRRGYGEHVHALHSLWPTLAAHAQVPAITGPEGNTRRAMSQIASLIDIGPIPTQSTESRAFGAVVDVTPDEDKRKRDIARRILSEWQSNPLDCARRIARGDTDGATLDPANGDTYTARRTQWANLDRTIRTD